MDWGIPHNQIWIVCGILIIVGLIGIVLIARRTSGLRLLIRSLLLVVGLIGLGLILLKPSTRQDIPSQTAHIITPYGESEKQNSYTSVHDFLNSEAASSTDKVQIHGIGLNTEELALLEGYHLDFIPTDTITGISEITLPKITEREQWTLRGKLQGAGITGIDLVSPDGSSSKATITGADFTIQSTAPVAGAYLYDIIALTESDSILEKLPIKVAHEPTWSMLVLSSFPSFEINYLKNYWTSIGNSFALRSQISKGKYSTSFSNSQRQDLNTLTRKTIQSFDYIITDIASWNQLSQQERNNILGTVANQGLALIFRAEQSDRKAQDITLPTLSSSEEIKWKTSADDVALLGYTSTANWRSARLQGHTLSKFRSRSLGHIALLTIEDTYKLILADQAKNYQNLWSTIFSRLYRDFSPTSQLSHNDWVWADEPTDITILTNQKISTPPIFNDSTELFFTDTPFLSGSTEVSALPQPGTNTIRIHDSEELTFYAHEQEAWAGVRQRHLAKINSVVSHERTDQAAPTTLTTQQEISLYWWYAITLLGLGGLWLHERYMG